MTYDFPGRNGKLLRSGIWFSLSSISFRNICFSNKNSAKNLFPKRKLEKSVKPDRKALFYTHLENLFSEANNIFSGTRIFPTQIITRITLFNGTETLPLEIKSILSLNRLRLPTFIADNESDGFSTWFEPVFDEALESISIFLRAFMWVLLGFDCSFIGIMFGFLIDLKSIIQVFGKCVPWNILQKKKKLVWWLVII